MEFLQSELCPKLDASKVVIMENLNIHRSREVEELIRGTGVRVLYLPVSVPELNPIEIDVVSVEAFYAAVFWNCTV